MIRKGREVKCTAGGERCGGRETWRRCWKGRRCGVKKKKGRSKRGTKKRVTQRSRRRKQIEEGEGKDSDFWRGERNKTRRTGTKADILTADVAVAAAPGTAGEEWEAQTSVWVDRGGPSCGDSKQIRQKNLNSVEAWRPAVQNKKGTVFWDPFSEFGKREEAEVNSSTKAAVNTKIKGETRWTLQLSCGNYEV